MKPTTRRPVATAIALSLFALGTGCAETGPTQAPNRTGTLDVVWQANALTFAAPIVADSLVITRLTNGALVALRRATGTVAWQGGGVGFNAGAYMRLAGDALIVPHAVLTAVDARTGELLWERPEPSGMITGSATPAVVGDELYLAEPGHATAVNAMTGVERWRTEIVDGPVSSPAAGGGRVIYPVRTAGAPGQPNTRGELVGVDIATGVESWRFDTPEPAGFGPAVAGVAIIDDRAIFATVGGRIVALTLDRGQVIWELPEDPEGPGYPAPPTVFAGLVVFLRTDGVLEARSPEDGSVAWTRSVPTISQFNRPPVTCGSFLCQGTGALSIISATGEVVWTSDDDAQLAFITPPAVDVDGILFAGVAIGFNDNRLLAIRPTVTVGASPPN